MSKGGYRPLTRAIQDMGEIEIGVGVYGHLDSAEDRLVMGLANFTRAVLTRFAPSQLPALDRWEQHWRSADRNADQSVLELRDLAVEASHLLDRARLA